MAPADQQKVEKKNWSSDQAAWIPLRYKNHVFPGTEIPFKEKTVVSPSCIYIADAYSGNSTLRWRHNDQDGVSNHQPRGYLLNRLFRRRSNKTSKLRVTGLCVGNSPGPVNSPHKGPVTRKMFPFDDVIMRFRVSCNNGRRSHECPMFIVATDIEWQDGIFTLKRSPLDIWYICWS